MGYRTLGLALLVASPASCALVLDYSDYTEQAQTTSTSTSTGVGGAGGGSGAGTTAGSTGVGGSAACADGGAPTVEICGNDVDEDCDGTTCAHKATWSHRYTDVGTPARDRAITAVAISGADIAIAGWYNGTLDLPGAPPLVDNLPVDREAFAARLGTDGSTKYLTAAQGANLHREAAGVALNGAATHLAMTGFVETGTATGRDMFVFHADQLNQQWTTQIGSTASDQGRVIAIAGNNDVLVAGTLNPGSGSLKCSAGDVSYSAAEPRMLVARLKASDGTCLWGKTFAATLVSPQGLLLDALGQVIVVGAYTGTLEGAPASSAAGVSTFALALDATSGVTAWIQAFPVTTATSFATPTGVAAGTDGRLYVSGSLRGTAMFGERKLSSTVAAAEDALVLSLDGSAAGKGALAWIHRFGGMDGFKRATAIGAVPQPGGDTLFVAGLAAGALSVEPDGDTGALCPEGGVFLLKLQGETPVWGDCFGQGGVDSLDVVRMANSGNRVVLAGARTLTIDFGDGPLTGTTFDAFAAQLSSL